MSATLQFLGAAGTVTGSRHLVTHGSQRLLVDCGLFQGHKVLRLRNWAELPFDAADIQSVLLTHAHLDHSGALPLLAHQGFKGQVHASAATADLCALLLPDSGHIQEEDAAFANRHGFSKHHPALPLYTKEQALQSLKLLRPHPMHQVFEPIKGWRAQFRPAGHILGASSILLELAGRKVLFSGDLGRSQDVLMQPPERPPQADTVVIESTYGDRLHEPVSMEVELAEALRRVSARGGVAVVPVFAVGRAQAVLHAIANLKASDQIPRSLPIFLDSPMAINATELLSTHPDAHRLAPWQVHALAHVATMVRTPEESKALGRHHGPMVILAASGMATGGRVLHHLGLYLKDHRNMVILTGFQAAGTRGARLAAGEPTLRLHGQDVPVHAEVVQLHSASAHADASELVQWLAQMPSPPDQVYVVHGEPSASDALRSRIERELGWRAVVPEHQSTWPI
jgi:metallo-beta-lactamase family protein